jgi:hypothetical protein
MATLRPYVAAYDCAIRSLHAFDTSYGYDGCSGVSSVYGSTACAPYALSDDAITICFTRGERRAASSSDHVPRMFDSNVDTGLRFAIGTIVCAARCSTVSISYSPRTRSMSA